MTRGSGVTAAAGGRSPGNTAVGLSADPTASFRSEHGVGALMPWAGALYIQTYLANSTGTLDNTGSHGSGSGLWRLADQGKPELVALDNGCHPARFVHKETSTLLIGIHAVDVNGNVSTIPRFAPDGASPTERVCGYARHLTSPTTKVYVFTMAGLLFEMTLADLSTTYINNVATVAGMTGATIHGKAIWSVTGAGRVYMAFNNVPSTSGNADGGRLMSWDGTTFTSQDSGNNSWINVGGSFMGNAYVWATGHDDLSGLLWLFHGLSAQAPRKFRIPFGSDQFRHYFQQEWQRCRAVETEHYLLDHHGTFYELSPYLTDNDGTFSTSFPRMHAISRHLRTIPDFCTYNGQLVIGGNETSEQYGQFPDAGVANSGLLFTNLDEIWKWGKPTGKGWWWKGSSVSSNQESTPMLARGYDAKVVHASNGTGAQITLDVIAYHGSQPYTIDTLVVPANSYSYIELPRSYSCDWLSVKATSGSISNVSAWVTYN